MRLYNTDVKRTRQTYDFILKEIVYLTVALRSQNIDDSVIDELATEVVIRNGWTPEEFISEARLLPVAQDSRLATEKNMLN